MNNISLLKKFTFLSFIAFFITGVILSFTITSHIKADKISNIQESSIFALDTTLKPNLKESDFNYPLSEQRKSVLEGYIFQIMQYTNIVGIGIWNNEQNPIYLSSLIRSYSSQELLQKTKNDGIQVRITTPQNFLDRNLVSNKMIQLYAPIVLDGKTAGTYEVLIPYQELQKHINSINMTVIFTMVSGLIILYLLLLKIIDSASRTLIRQNESLTIQKKELELSFAELDASYKNTVIALSSAIDARDPYTAGHSQRVTQIALEIGKKLGLSDDRLKALELAALLHDIGKIGIPDHILNKPCKLKDNEYSLIKKHPAIGVKILEKIGFLQDILPIILHHHERFAGGGYPNGLVAESIPLEARIIAVADTYDAITSDRPYRKGAPHQIALNEIIKLAGIQFDEEVVYAFLKIEEFTFNRVSSVNA